MDQLREIYDSYQQVAAESGKPAADAYLQSLPATELDAYLAAESNAVPVDDDTSGPELSAAAAGCFERNASILYESGVFRANLFRYHEYVYWCSNGVTITSYSCNAYGEVFDSLWSFVGNITSCYVEAGGIGSTFVQEFSQGKFHSDFAGKGLQTFTPYVRVIAQADGSASEDKH